MNNFRISIVKSYLGPTYVEITEYISFWIIFKLIYTEAYAIIYNQYMIQKWYTKKMNRWNRRCLAFQTPFFSIAKFCSWFEIQKFRISKIPNPDIWCLNLGHFAIFEFGDRFRIINIWAISKRWWKRWFIYMSHALWVTICWYLAGYKLFRKV